MKSHRGLRLLSGCFGLVILASCATTGLRVSQPPDFIEPLHKLTLAVKAELENPFSPMRPSGGELLTVAMQDKPELQRVFKGIPVLITNQSDHAVVLLLNPTKKNVAWLEFATWSRELDKFHYLSNPPSPAEFTIPLPEKATSPRP
jgi:hypothetical protein